MTMNIQEITPSQVVRAYVGRAGACACGCSGKHYEADDLAMRTKVLRTIQANEDRVEVDSDWVSVQIKGKEYVAFFTE